MLDPKSCSVQELLHLYVEVLDELRQRNIVRTSNSPVGDYAEWLAAHCLGLTLVSNSMAGYDALDRQGIRYQIKCRRITQENKSRQLSAIRNLDACDFDFLLIILFNHDMKLQKVLKMPHSLVGRFASYRKHVNAHILTLRDSMLADPLVEDLTDQFN